MLSQQEIDALLSAISTGEVNAEEIKHEESQKRVKQWDFRRPDKFSKDQVRTLEMLYENYARHLTTSLATFLRTAVEVKLVSVQQMTYGEFVQSLPNPTIMCSYSLKPLSGSAVLEMNPELGLMIVERLLGGKLRLPDKPRELTDIEQTILRKVILRILSHVQEAWENVAEVQASLERMELNPQFIQVVAPNQMVILITLSVKGEGSEGFMNFCLSDTLLEPVLPKLSAHYWFGSARQTASKETLEALRRRVERTKVDVVANVGSCTVTVRELMALRPGDVIVLSTRADSACEVRVGSSVKFRGKPGVLGSKLAVQIVSVERGGDGE